MSEQLAAEALAMLEPYEAAPVRYCGVYNGPIPPERNAKGKFCSDKCKIRWSNQLQRDWSPERRAQRNRRDRERYAMKKAPGLNLICGSRAAWGEQIAEVAVGSNVVTRIGRR